MQDLKYKMLRYMSAEELAESTIIVYSSCYEKIKSEVKTFENRGSSFWIEYLSNIHDPINRNNYRSVILKVCRDVLNENLKLPIVKRPVRLQAVYTLEEVNLIFAQIKNPKHYAIASLLFVEGFRVGEVLSVKLSDCNKKDGSITLRETKNGKDYKKHLDETTITAIREYYKWLLPAEKTKVYLFEGWTNQQYTSSSVQQFMKKAIRTSGLPVKGACHIFRRSNAVWKIENNWSVQHIAASLNNSPKTASKYYALIRPEYLKTLQKPTPCIVNQN